MMMSSRSTADEPTMIHGDLPNKKVQRLWGWCQVSNRHPWWPMKIDRKIMRMADLIWSITVTVASVGPQQEFGSPLSPGLKVSASLWLAQVGLKPPLARLNGSYDIVDVSSFFQIWFDCLELNFMLLPGVLSVHSEHNTSYCYLMKCQGRKRLPVAFLPSVLLSKINFDEYTLVSKVQINKSTIIYLYELKTIYWDLTFFWLS